MKTQMHGVMTTSSVQRMYAVLHGKGVQLHGSLGRSDFLVGEVQLLLRVLLASTQQRQVHVRQMGMLQLVRSLLTVFYNLLWSVDSRLLISGAAERAAVVCSVYA
jgi:hypothetical protein